MPGAAGAYAQSCARIDAFAAPGVYTREWGLRRESAPRLLGPQSRPSPKRNTGNPPVNMNKSVRLLALVSMLCLCGVAIAQNGAKKAPAGPAAKTAKAAKGK